MVGLLVAVNFGNAWAGEPDSDMEKESRLWITTGFISYHPNRDANYNENNIGIGFEYHLDKVSSFALGHYKNSIRKDSTYIQYVYTPLALGSFRFGGAAGLVNGYPYLNKGDYAPVLMPVATVAFKLFGRDAGVNAVYIPSLIPHVDSSFALQFKFAIDN